MIARLTQDELAPERREVTISRPALADATATVVAMMDALNADGLGYTVGPPGLGGWRGRSEPCYSLVTVGAESRRAAALAVAAAHAAGCVAVQVETWTGRAYSVAEVRP
jgi:hypothetical protein